MKLSLALVFALLGAASLRAADAPKADSAAAMTAAAQAFIKSLTAEEAKKTVLSYDDPKRTDWHNIPKDMRKGFQVKDMSAAQKELCHKLLQASLSKSGYEKAVRIMALEQNLLIGEMGKGPLRDPVRYFLTIFGTPDSKGTWGYSFEGHHLSLNFVIRDGAVISTTPSFWGANPATVKVFVAGGPEVGVRTLAAEEQLALDLVNSLDDSQRKIALQAETAPPEYRAGGQPQPPQAPPAGLIAEKMTEAQRKLLWSLLETYNQHLADDVAAKNLDLLKSEGLDRVHFAWWGSLKPGVGHYYRVQGPSFVLEFINVQSDPAGNKANHIHSVWRNLKGDFALPAQP